MADAGQEGTDEIPAPTAEHRRFLLNAHASAFESFDKAVLAIAGGAIGTSLAFFRAIVGPNPPHLPSLLFWGWGVLVVAVLATFVSFLTSERAINEEISSIDEGRPPGRAFHTVTQWLNWLSAACVVAGVIFVLLFAAANISGRGHGSVSQGKQGDSLRKGYVPAPPPARPGRPLRQRYVPPPPPPQRREAPTTPQKPAKP
jgi:uncharacterized membrane protein YjfL (UPF0719 family)